MNSDFSFVMVIQRLRKMRRCFWCEDRLELGDTAVRLSGKQEGIMFTFYVHPQCNEAWLRDPCNGEEQSCNYAHIRGMTCNETTEAEEAVEEIADGS